MTQIGCKVCRHHNEDNRYIARIYRNTYKAWAVWDKSTNDFVRERQGNFTSVREYPDKESAQAHANEIK